MYVGFALEWTGWDRLLKKEIFAMIQFYLKVSKHRVTIGKINQQICVCAVGKYVFYQAKILRWEMNFREIINFSIFTIRSKYQQNFVVSQFLQSIPIMLMRNGKYGKNLGFHV